MSREVIACGNTEIKKRKFYYLKNLILLEDVDIDKIQVSSMLSTGEKAIKILLVTKTIVKN